MSNTLKYKGFVAKIDFDDRDDIFVGRLIGIDDTVMFHSETVQGLKTAFREAVDFHIEVCEKTGGKLKKEYSGNLLFRFSPELHKSIEIAAASAGKSINEWGKGVLQKAASENK